MILIKNIVITGANNYPIAIDVCYNPSMQQQPVVVYAHGFNGFKDWGNGDLIAAEFANAGFVFLKFNFSHNGTSPSQPETFVDLEAFGLNNYTKELYDLKQVIDWICEGNHNFRSVINTNQIHLLGHSRGGGIAIIYTAEDARIRKLITWASVSVCKTPWGNWLPEKIAEWEKVGVAYYTNGRTQQQMPLYFQLCEDYEKNAQRLNLERAIGKITVPILICHGSTDTSVNISNALQLKQWQPNAILFTLATDHVFGRKHPWLFNYLPATTTELLKASIQFLKEEK